MPPQAPKLTLKSANLRLCRLCKWSNYTGLGFNLKPGTTPPYTVSIVESNSPASSAGLKINDVILAVNKDEMQKVKYEKLTQAIQKARDKGETIDLLVMEKRFYDQVKSNNIKIDPKQANVLSAPKTMPDDYANFPKHMPRTCLIELTDASQSFGFDLVNGENDTGVFVQEAHPNAPAANAGLRKSDRIISIDDELVDDKPSTVASQKIKEAKANLRVKLYVMDTQTYKHYKNNNLPLESVQAYENVNVSTTRPAPSNHYTNDSDSDSDATSPSAPARQISDRDNPRGVAAIVKPSKSYGKPTDPLTDDPSDEDIRSNVNKKPGVQPSAGISAIAKGHPVEPDTSGGISQSKRRKYRLIRDQRLGYGFTLKTGPSGKYPNQIGVINSGSPAAQQGLRVNDYILSVNNKNVEQMDNETFKAFLRSSGTESEKYGDPLILEVINEDAISSRASAISEISEPKKQPVIEIYPNMRRCTIRAWSKYPGLGFEIIQSPDTYAGSAGYQIKRLKPNSPAEQTKIRNDDYIIEVNGLNIENEDFEDLRDDIRNTYKADKKIELLVIDEDGYKWYKSRKYRINPRSSEAKVTSHRTPDSPPESPSSRKSVHTSSTYRPQSSEPITPPPIHTTNKWPKNDKTVDTSPYGNDRSSSQHAGASMSIKGQNRPLSRGAIDVVSEKRLLRLHHLKFNAGKKIGFNVTDDNDKHIIRNIQPDSPAALAGFQDYDCIIEVGGENVENKSNKEVIGLLASAAKNGNVRLLIAPSNTKSSNKRSGKVDGERTYGNLPPQSKREYHSSSQHNNNGINDNRSYKPDDLNNFSLEPTNPLPRRCVLYRDSDFPGCGFRAIEKRNYDTPIVIEVRPNSPAKRSGLSVGDHIVYIQSKNIQNFNSFEEKINFIKREFEETGEITLVTLTGPAFQILKQRGGYLEKTEFDYEAPNTDHVKPRLCKLNFHAHEHDYGLSFRRDNVLYIEDVEAGSSADTYGIEKGNIVLELNGQDTKYLTKQEVRKIIEDSKQKRSLDILFIDIDGYRYATNHAIPLNSLLPFVQPHKGQTTTTTNDHSNNGVYL